MNISKINLRDPKMRTAAFILLIGAAGVAWWYNMVFSERNSQLEVLKATHAKKQEELTAILAMKPQLERLRADIRSEQVLLDSLKAMFPDQKEVPRLIQEITRHAQETGIYTVKFNPLEDMVREYYVENRYELALWGNYHSFAEFVSRLANLKLIVNLTGVKLSAHPSVEQAMRATGGGAEPEYTMIANFTMTTFSSKQ